MSQLAVVNEKQQQLSKFPWDHVCDEHILKPDTNIIKAMPILFALKIDIMLNSHFPDASLKSNKAPGISKITKITEVKITRFLAKLRPVTQNVIFAQ